MLYMAQSITSIKHSICYICIELLLLLNMVYAKYVSIYLPAILILPLNFTVGKEPSPEKVNAAPVCTFETFRRTLGF